MEKKEIPEKRIKIEAEKNSFRAEKLFSQHLWACAPILAQFVIRKAPLFQQATVLELGAGGTGLPGMAAAKCGAAKIYFTDHPDSSKAFPLLRNNCAANKIKNYEIIPLAWGDLTADLNIPHIDIILASDCFFDPNVFNNLIATIALLLHKSSGEQEGVCFFSYQERSSDWEIHDLLRQWNLKCELIPPENYRRECIVCPQMEDGLDEHTIHIGKIFRAPETLVQ